MDPPYEWHTADDALAGLRDWGLTTENTLMYFPRILAHDKLRGHFESFAPCGAVAGMLARIDEAHPVWGESRMEDAVLRPGYRPVCLVAEDRRKRLLLRGVNTLQAVRSVGRIGIKPRTLAAGTAGGAGVAESRGASPGAVHRQQHRARHALGGRRRAVAARCRRWSRRKRRLFFEQLYEAGAFGARRREESFYVVCDRRMNAADEAHAGVFQFLIGFAASRRMEFPATASRTRRPAAR